MKRPTIAAISVSVLTTSVVSPWESTSESASTSEVIRAMIQPAFCCEKYLQRQRGQVVEEIFAQPEHDVLADAREPAHERRLQDPGECVDDEVDDDVAGEPRLVVRLHAVVDRVLDDEQRSDGAAAEQMPTTREERDTRPAAR